MAKNKKKKAPRAFPALHGTQTIPLTGPFEGVSVVVRAVRSRVARRWTRRFLRFAAEETVRIEAEQAAEPNKTAPCYKKGYVTEQGAEDWLDLCEEVCRATLVSIVNALFGNEPSENITDIDRLIEAMDATNMLGIVGVVACNAQMPTQDQKKV